MLIKDTKERHNNSQTVVFIMILELFQCYVQLSERTKLWLSSLHSSGEQFDGRQDKNMTFD